MIQTLDDDDRGERTRKKTVSFGSAQRVSREQLEKENRQIERPTTRKSLIELLLFFFSTTFSLFNSDNEQSERERARTTGRERERDTEKERRQTLRLSLGSLINAIFFLFLSLSFFFNV